MQISSTTAELDTALTALRSRGRVGLVPTMGNLHEGHIALVERCVAENAATVVSLFVNPLQFGPNEDFASYPRTLEADTRLLTAAKVDLVFTPSDAEIYPDGREGVAVVSVPRISHILCGASRPGHFDGVATVVLKLFNLVRPASAYFGEKDYQQLTLIRRMVRDLNVPVTIVGVPTVRAVDGLALSSRNQYLTEEERRTAPGLAATLEETVAALDTGVRDFDRLESDATRKLEQIGFRTDYVAVRDAETLDLPGPETRTFVVLAAARLGRARLIDNLRTGSR